MKKWGALAVLGAAQFLMVLDQAVMNVSISQLVEDFDTEVSAVQGVITMYSLVMAAFMITGGKIGDLIGRRRAFSVGLVIYAVGSALTAVSWSVGSLLLGWSILEGLGAILVLPALAALVAGNYTGSDRTIAYAVIGGIAGVGIAVGPILGGWATTVLSWRVVFVGEVVVAAIILIATPLVADVPRPGPAPKLDWVGAGLSAAGIGLVVLGILAASSWGWLQPKNSPVEPFGFALTPFVIGAGALLMMAFVAWERRRERLGQDPLIHFRLFNIRPLRSGLETFLAQNLVLMGVFFTIPLYLQLVQGLDALETGIRMLPASIAMLVTSLLGAGLAKWLPARTIVRAGLALLLVATVLMLGAIEPDLDTWSFGLSMAVLGVGMGLLASQLGNVVQSAVGAKDRSEAGGLQYTAQQLGSALGVALIGAIVLTGLAQNFVQRISTDERIEAEVQEEVSIAALDGIDFVSSDDVATAAGDAGLDEATTEALVENYEEAQLSALQAGLFVVGIVVVGAFFVTGGLPAKRWSELEPIETVPG